VDLVVGDKHDSHSPATTRTHHSRELARRQVTIVDGDEWLVGVAAGPQDEASKSVAPRSPLVAGSEEFHLGPARRYLHGNVLVAGHRSVSGFEVLVPKLDDLVVGHGGDALAAELEMRRRD
jgi:hypothetical protein